ncbi:MAG TPA: GIY-YIG nuclease family protein [Terriglobales bacterium]|nr:GIY-YIG nuclease family protein [Terriglobales bacterium]
MKYWFYIMASVSGTLYSGMTNDIQKRVFQHKNKLIEGFSARYGCNRLVYFESFDDVRKAIDREKEVKGWSRKKRIALIESMNPRWEDLALNWNYPILMQNESIAEFEERAARARKLAAPRKK